MSSALFVVICCLKRKVEKLKIFSFIFFRLEQLLFLPSATETPRGYFQVIGQWGCAAGCTFSSTIYQSLNTSWGRGGSETQAAYTQKNLIVLPPPPQPGQDTHSKFPPPGEITYLDLPSPTPPSSHTMFPLPAFAEKAKQQQMSLSAGTADNDAITAYLTIENTPLSLTALRPLKRL